MVYPDQVLESVKTNAQLAIHAAVRGLFVCSVDLLLWVRLGVWGFHVYSWLKHCGARPFTGTYRNDIVDAWLKDT